MSSILITGCGFFTKHFVARLLRDSLSSRIVVLSRDEMKLRQAEIDFNHDPRLRLIPGDIRDLRRLTRSMAGVDVVIAAAALKRIQTGAYAPDQIVLTNVVGSMNTIEAAAAAGVQKVVFLSSDKAWQPQDLSAYGQSKALSETLFLAANNMFGAHGPKFSCTRYGNIWCSRGSVVPTWRAMIAAGAKTVPVTDPDCTRFFMRIEEAVQLVLETLDTMKGGELVIPDWLPAYRLGDLAEAMQVEMEFTGLPSYEKRTEGMRDGLTSDIVRRLTVDELRAELRRDEPQGSNR